MLCSCNDSVKSNADVNIHSSTDIDMIKDTCEGLDGYAYFNCINDRPYFEVYDKLTFGGVIATNFLRVATSPDKFNNKRIFIYGYFLKDNVPDRGSLYFSREEMEYLGPDFTLDFESAECDTKEKIAELDVKRVFVIGTFYDKAYYSISGDFGLIKVERMGLDYGYNMFRYITSKEKDKKDIKEKNNDKK